MNKKNVQHNCKFSQSVRVRLSVFKIFRKVTNWFWRIAKSLLQNYYCMQKSLSIYLLNILKRQPSWATKIYTWNNASV